MMDTVRAATATPLEDLKKQVKGQIIMQKNLSILSLRVDRKFIAI